MLTPGLTSAYETRGPQSLQPALILLSDRPEASSEAGDLQRQGYALARIHERVGQSLRAAQARQDAVLKSLAILESTGMAADVRPLWIVNAVAAQLTRPAAELIANMTEVEAVGVDDPVVLRNLVEFAPAGGAQQSDDGLTRIGIPGAWRAGFRGEGRIVCVIADGAPSAPAFTARWRGTTAPAAECWHNAAGVRACGNTGAAMLGALCIGEAAVAPEARWIAAPVLCNSARFSDLLLALEWAADPDGDLATFADVPDVICSAWGMKARCTGDVPDGIWEAISNVEALGPLPVFAVSQEGGTVRLPEAFESCLAVGNADASGSTTLIHSSSARGPSPCDPTLVKPDVCAPGVSVRVASESGFARATGSPVAAARVAGVIALLRQANPDLPAAEIKRILVRTTTDLGGSGPDNTFGFGMVNADRALAMALSSGISGNVQGTVMDGERPVNGARIALAGETGEITVTSRNGYFSFDHVPAGRRYALRAGRFGYRPYSHSDSISVEPGSPASIMIALDRGFDDDAEFDQGWSLGVDGDNATGGVWVRAVPIGSKVGGRFVQPDADASVLGTRCFVTGNASSPSADASENDVDGGRTTLRSPIFSLLGVDSPVVKFSYWFSNDRGSNPGSDFFRAQISNDGGRTWKDLINSAASTDGWKTVRVRVSDFLVPSERMCLQFVAEDAGPGSLVEAAVDDISITGAQAALTAPADLTLDVQSDRVRLSWRPSPGASSYRVYLSGSGDRVVAPENLYATVRDTTLVVPMSDIRFNEFFFQVTASK